MNCPNCGQQTEEGKFCTSCGTQLPNKEYAAAADPTINTPPQQQQQTKQEQTKIQSNETVEKMKATGSNFGNFFVTLLKQPSEAKKVDSKDLPSGIITIIIFSLLIALGYHLSIRGVSAGFIQISFFDSFVLPFVEFVVLFGIVASLTFAGAKMAVQAVTYTDTIAKYGAYLTPFLLLYATGFLLNLIGLTDLAALVILVSILGAIVIVPTLILLEKPASGFDRLYVLIAIYLISMLVFGFFVRTFIESLFGGLMGGLFG
ncbi:hypothetical protein ACFQ3N_07840 [Virgibacillus byunsanensis]|uniref:Zinc ribbon domain-containing protein n=1 Tax=Virgibacillus byunsanensis TaxID=570945 RepID=A0ABW3LJV7_9BACI